MPTPRAFITGVGGQDGSLLAGLLLDNGYEVTGVVRRDASAYAEALAPLEGRVALVEANLLDHASLVDGASSDPPDRGLQPRRAVVRARARGTSRS